MTSRNSRPRSSAILSWQRRIDPRSAESWIARLQEFAGPAWSMTQKTGEVRALLVAYPSSRKEGLMWVDVLGGALKRVTIQPRSAGQKSRTRVDARLEILHTPPRRVLTSRQLYLPHGMAFGSGEHATTLMLLREMTRRSSLAGSHVLDLGTGSGILALLARRLGASHIVATDFDRTAFRTARANELLNFPESRILWRVADVRKLRARGRHQLVLANLFSGILIEAAPLVALAVAPGGELWLSGILKSQSAQVEKAYRIAGLKFLWRKSLGKWVMLRFIARATAQETGGALMKRVQKK